ncbi:unnamed protein product, partial [marine sediment metagenome]
MPEEEDKQVTVVLAIATGLFGLVVAATAYGILLDWAAPPAVYTCPHCGTEFATEGELLAHIQAEHPEQPSYICPQCGEAFWTEEELQQHIELEHPPEPPPPALANLYGVVTDAETGAPLANVSVQLWSPDGAELILSSSTDSSGRYSMADILPYNYLIRFEKDGYGTKSDDIFLAEGDNELDVQMMPLPPELPPVGDFVYSEQTCGKRTFSAAPAWNQPTFSIRITNQGTTEGTRVITLHVRAVEMEPGWPPYEHAPWSGSWVETLDP